MSYDEWMNKALSDSPVEIIDGDRGKNYPNGDALLGSGYCLFLSAKNVTENGFVFDQTIFITREKDATLRKGKLKRHDIVLTTRGTVGNVAYYGDVVSYSSIRINSGMVILRTDPYKLFPPFLYWVLRSPFVQDQIRQLRTGSAQPQLPISILNRVSIPFPPLPEQRAIAATLSCLDDKIELNNRMNKTLEEMAQAIFKSWFVDFEPFQDGAFVDSELGRIPKGWRVGTLTEIADFLNGLAMQKFRPTEGEIGLPVLKIKELGQARTDSNSDLCSSELDSKYIVHDGDIIFSWSGTLLVDIWCGGMCGLNQHLFKVTPKIYPKWYTYFWTKSHLARFQAIARDKATTMGHIKRGELDNSQVLVPDDESMKKLNGTMMPLLDMLIANRIQSRMLEETREDLLPRLMNGDIRVPTNP